MAKVKVKFNASNAIRKFKDELDKLARKPQIEAAIGSFVTERVRFEARRGKPLNNQRSFPDLSNVSKAIRDRLSKLNSTHGAFRPGKSNLTFSGQLQDAVTFKRKRGGLFELFVKNSSRKRLITGAGKSQKQPNNAEVDSELRAMGFELFTAKGLTSDRKIGKRIKQIYLRFLRRQLRRT